MLNRNEIRRSIIRYLLEDSNGFSNIRSHSIYHYGVNYSLSADRIRRVVHESHPEMTLHYVKKDGEKPTRVFIFGHGRIIHPERNLPVKGGQSINYICPAGKLLQMGSLDDADQLVYDEDDISYAKVTDSGAVLLKESDPKRPVSIKELSGTEKIGYTADVSLSHCHSSFSKPVEWVLRFVRFLEQRRMIRHIEAIEKDLSSRLHAAQKETESQPGKTERIQDLEAKLYALKGMKTSLKSKHYIQDSGINPLLTLIGIIENELDALEKYYQGGSDGKIHTEMQRLHTKIEEMKVMLHAYKTVQVYFHDPDRQNAYSAALSERDERGLEPIVLVTPNQGENDLTIERVLSRLDDAGFSPDKVTVSCCRPRHSQKTNLYRMELPKKPEVIRA